MTTPVLYRYQNPNAPVRSDGRRGWYHPHRRGGLSAIRVIGIHTTENDPGPGVAMNVATWQARSAPRPSSYHQLVDTRDIVVGLPDEAVAMHIANFNTPTLGLAAATRAHLWGRNPSQDRAMVERMAQVAARWVAAYGIPLRWITRAQANAGAAGFVRHSVMDPDRRGDPGDGFPASLFFDLIRAQSDPLEEWYMSLSESDRAKLDRLLALPQSRWDNLIALADTFSRGRIERLTILARLSENQITQVARFARRVVARGSSGQGIVDATLDDHRARRDAGWEPADYRDLRGLAQGMRAMNTTPRTLGRTLVAMVREARARGWHVSPARFAENRTYTAEDIE